jgi:putative membrane protein
MAPEEHRRRPHRVYYAGDDPDPRFSLANERTFLSWVRTSLALTAGAVAVHMPLLDLSRGVRLGLSTWLLLLAVMTAVLAWYRWTRSEMAMRGLRPMPGFRGGLSFLFGVSVLIVAVFVLGFVEF